MTPLKLAHKTATNGIVKLMQISVFTPSIELLFKNADPQLNRMLTIAQLKWRILSEEKKHWFFICPKALICIWSNSAVQTLHCLQITINGGGIESLATIKKRDKTRKIP